jgi:palmitoyltransferase
MPETGKRRDNKCVQVFLRVIRWLPILFVAAIVAWIYYAFGYEFCFKVVTNIPERIAYLVVYNILMLMFLWSYVQTVITDAGKPPPQYELSPEVRTDLSAAESEGDYRTILSRFVRQQGLEVTNQAYGGGPRYCLKCECIKPDRSHHCSVCGHCVLKFDHHCPWVNNCVNFRNYKFFMLFLGYGFCLCNFGFCTLLPIFIGIWNGTNVRDEIPGKFHVLFLFFIAAMLGIPIGCLFFYHLYLTARNQSTVESFRPPIFAYGLDRRGYNLGFKNNFKEVFGKNVLLWFIPIFSARGNGSTWKMRIGCDPSTT